MAEIISHSEEINLPVVPLRGMVAFPSVPMSIEVAREKSIGAIRVAERLGGDGRPVQRKGAAYGEHIPGVKLLHGVSSPKDCAGPGFGAAPDSRPVRGGGIERQLSIHPILL